MKFDRIAFLYLLALQAVLALVWHSDPLLNDSAAQHFHPYSQLWFLLNPLWDRGHEYLYFLLAMQLAFAGALWRGYREGRRSFWAIMLAQFMNVFLVLTADPESVVPMQFAYLGFPGAILVAALMRFPWDLAGWNFILFGPHPEFWWNLMVRAVSLLSVLLFFYDWLSHRKTWKVPLPWNHVLAFTANKGGLRFGVALWRNKEDD